MEEIGSFKIITFDSLPLITTFQIIKNIKKLSIDRRLMKNFKKSNPIKILDGSCFMHKFAKYSMLYGSLLGNCQFGKLFLYI